MSSLGWIICSSLGMCAIALVGSATLVLSEHTLQKILLPLVAFAAGIALMWFIKLTFAHASA